MVRLDLVPKNYPCLLVHAFNLTNLLINDPKFGCKILPTLDFIILTISWKSEVAVLHQFDPLLLKWDVVLYEVPPLLLILVVVLLNLHHQIVVLLHPLLILTFLLLFVKILDLVVNVLRLDVYLLVLILFHLLPMHLILLNMTLYQFCLDQAKRSDFHGLDHHHKDWSNSSSDWINEKIRRQQQQQRQQRQQDPSSEDYGSLDLPRERLPWRTHTSIYYDRLVKHTCSSCLIPKRGSAFKLWWASHDGEHHLCSSCYFKGSDIMPRGCEDVATMKRLRKRMEELGPWMMCSPNVGWEALKLDQQHSFTWRSVDGNGHRWCRASRNTSIGPIALLLVAPRRNLCRGKRLQRKRRLSKGWDDLILPSQTSFSYRDGQRILKLLKSTIVSWLNVCPHRAVKIMSLNEYGRVLPSFNASA